MLLSLGPGSDAMLTLIGIEELEDYVPYTLDIVIESRVSRMEAAMVIEQKSVVMKRNPVMLSIL